MSYTRVNWQNAPSTATPVNAENLNTMDKGIADAHSQLAENTNQLYEKESKIINTFRANGKRRCIVSFTSDDGKVEDYTILKPIFQEKGIPCGTNIIAKGSGQLSDDQIRELVALGWDTGSHTVNHYRLPTLTEEEIDYELRESKRMIEARGFSADFIVYPNGENDERVRRIASKYYKFGLATGAALASYPVKTYQINRVMVGAYFDGVGKDTLTYYKSMFDQAYANKQWVIFTLHPAAVDFDATQQQHLKDLIDYIKTFPDVPIMTVTDAYKEMGNMISVGDGTTERLVVTNAGDIIENEALYSNELTNTSKAFLTGTGTGQTTPVNFIDNAPLKISLTAQSAMTNPSIISVGKNIWGGLKFANDVITAVNNPAYAYYTVVDGKRVLALVGNAAISIPFFNKGFISGKRYVISLSWRRADGATGGGGRFSFKYTDGTQTNATSPVDTTWTTYKFGSAAGKDVESINGNYGSVGQTTYIDIDSFQLELGIVGTSIEAYKESRLDITASLVANDVLTFENNKLYQNATSIPFKRNLKAYKNGTIYVSDNSSPIIKITYPLNSKAAKDLLNTQFISN